MSRDAYLIVVCDKETNAVKSVCIWSSPEWEQSRCLDDVTYVAYATKGATYADARRGVLQAMAHPRSRYHWLIKGLSAEDQRVVQEMSAALLAPSSDEKPYQVFDTPCYPARWKVGRTTDDGNNTCNYFADRQDAEAEAQKRNERMTNALAKLG